LVALSQLQPAWLLAWPAARDPDGIRCGAARCRQSCGSRGEWRAAPDPGGLATATTTCGPSCAKQPHGFNRDPRCSTQCLKGTDDAGWSRRRRVLTAPRQPAIWLDSWDPLGSLGLEGTRPKKEVTGAARSTPVSARRRRSGGGTRQAVGHPLW
jgi:hypothetical protein